MSISLNSFSGVISPFSTEEFFESKWTKEFLYVEGDSNKFSNLLPWHELNRILKQHRLDSPRLRIVKDGEAVSPSEYQSYTRNQRGDQIPWLIVSELNNHLKQGATLVVDAIDEMHRPITRLSEALEKKFHEYIQVNAYAGWGASHGFDLHWDDHDVFIMQVTGRKKWEVFGPTRKYPLHDDVKSPSPPTSDPIWKGEMTSGDFLYIPRGSWHVAAPVGDPTLHLTFGINNRTGMHFMEWFKEKLCEREIFRKDLPRFSDKKNRDNHLRDLKSAFLDVWDEDLLEEFFEEYDARAIPRVETSLPWGTASEPPLTNDQEVKIRASRSPVVHTTDDTIDVSTLGRRWQFDISVKPVLEPLLDGEVCRVKDIVDAGDDTLEESKVRQLIRELISSSLITVTDK